MMETRTKRLGICAVAITLVWTIVNYILGHTYGKIIGITDGGGEVSFTFGFGIVLKKTWPLSSIDNPIESTTKVVISPLFFCVTALLLWILLFTIFWVIDKIRGKKAKTENN